MRAERPILLRFLNVLTSLNDFIIKRIVFLFLVKYIASGTLIMGGYLKCLETPEDPSMVSLVALLFVLSVEIMALRIRNNKNIKGFQVKIDEINHSIKISQLADDTTLFFNSKTEISLALNEIEIFGSFRDLL